MTQWREVALGEVCSMASGKTRPVEKDGPYPLYGSNGRIGWSPVRLAERGIVVGRVGAYCGSLALSTTPFWATDNTIVLNPDSETDLRFLFYALSQANPSSLAGGAAQPLINQGRLRALVLPIPDRDAQVRIASTLAAFDELIAINERRIELLEDLVRTIYREWFMRFRAPGTVAVGDDGLPSGWSIARLGEVATLNYGKALPAGKRRRGPIAVVSSAGVIDEHDIELVEGPGVVLGRKGNVGSVWWIDRPFFPIDTTFYIDTDMPLGLLYWQLRDMTFIDSHAAVPGLNRDYAYGLRVVVPADDVAARFAEIHQVLFDEISLLRRQTSALGATRDLLLPRLLSGQLDISDIDLGDLLTEDAT